MIHDEITLELTLRCLHRAFAAEQLQRLKVEAEYSPEIRAMVVSATWVVAARQAQGTIKCPSTWWEAFKERWFHARMLVRWPVKYVKWRAWEVLPSVPLPAPMQQLSYHEFRRAFD